MSSDNESERKPDLDGSDSPSLPPSPTPQRKTPTSPSKKRTTQPKVKTEVTGPSSPTKKSPQKKAAGGEKGGSTNLTMAADVVKHALTLINADELKVVAERLGVDPVKLRDSWRKNWLPRAIKAADTEFGVGAGPKA